MSTDSRLDRKFWQVAIADLEKQLATGGNGLSSAEVATRGSATAPTPGRAAAPVSAAQIPRPVPQPARDHSLERRRRISAATGDLTSFIIILTIVLTSAVLDTVQEYRAEGSRRVAQGLGRAQGTGPARRAARLRCWGRTSSPAMS